MDDEDVPFYIIGTKSDLASGVDIEKLQSWDENIKLFATSARNGEGVDTAFNEIIDQMITQFS